MKINNFYRYGNITYYHLQDNQNQIYIKEIEGQPPIIFFRDNTTMRTQFSNKEKREKYKNIKRKIELETMYLTPDISAKINFLFFGKYAVMFDNITNSENLTEEKKEEYKSTLGAYRETILKQGGGKAI